MIAAALAGAAAACAAGAFVLRTDGSLLAGLQVAEPVRPRASALGALRSLPFVRLLVPRRRERRTRAACREKFKEVKLLERILPDIDELLGIQMETLGVGDTDADPALPELLWSPPESVEPEAAP